MLRSPTTPASFTLRGAPLRATKARPVALRGPTPPRAGFFDFLSPKPEEDAPKASAESYICLDCGVCGKRFSGNGADLGGGALQATYTGQPLQREYVHVSLPRLQRWREPLQKGGRAGLAVAQKTALKAAKKAAPKGGPKPRELLKQRAIDAAREKDSGKSKGWF